MTDRDPDFITRFAELTEVLCDWGKVTPTRQSEARQKPIPLRVGSETVHAAAILLIARLAMS